MRDEEKKMTAEEVAELGNETWPIFREELIELRSRVFEEFGVGHGHERRNAAVTLAWIYACLKEAMVWHEAVAAEFPHLNGYCPICKADFDPNLWRETP
jgi:hypothetical protein